MSKKEELMKLNKTWYNFETSFISRVENRKSIPICVKISEKDKIILEKLRGNKPLSSFLRESALKNYV